MSILKGKGRKGNTTKGKGSSVFQEGVTWLATVTKGAIAHWL